MEKNFKKGDEIVVKAKVVGLDYGEDVLLQIDVWHYINLSRFTQATADLCNTFMTSKENIKSRELGITDVELAASCISNLIPGKSVFVKVLFECNVDNSICCARALTSYGKSSYFILPVSAILGCSDELDNDAPDNDESASDSSSHKTECSDGSEAGMLIAWNLMKILLSYDEKTLKDSFGYRTLPDLLANRDPKDVIDLLYKHCTDDAFNLLVNCAGGAEKQSTKRIVKKKGGTFSHGKEIQKG